MDDKEFEKRILEDISNLRRNLAQKADKSQVEQIASLDEEIQNLKMANTNRLDTIERDPNDPEVICQRCIDNDDMETAFLTVLRFIESISATKAESRMVDNKASKKYVESLFDHLNVITRQQITEANEHLRDTLEVTLNKLSDNFDFFTKNITKRIERCEADVENIEEFIAHAKFVTQRKVEDFSTHSNKGTPEKKSTKPLSSFGGKVPHSRQRAQKQKAQKRQKELDLLISTMTTSRR